MSQCFPACEPKCSSTSVDLALDRGGGQGGEEVRAPEVAVVLRDLVLEHEVVPPGVPGEVRDEPVVLVPVVPVVGEDEVGRALALERLERLLHRRAGVGQEPVPELVHDDARARHARQEGRCGGARLGGPRRRRAEDHPRHLDVPEGGEAEHRAAAADLDVVAVGAEREDAPGSAVVREQVDGAHGFRSRLPREPTTARSRRSATPTRVELAPAVHEQRRRRHRLQEGGDRLVLAPAGHEQTASTSGHAVRRALGQ